MLLLLPAALLVRPAALSAQQAERPLSGLSGREAGLRDEVVFLCDSLCAGRGFGTAGAQASTLYLLRQLRDAGLRTTVQSFAAGGRIGHNVVAVTPGWFRRYIVVGAYFDALGTLDGIRIDENMNAVDKDGEPIPGLYVCGNDSGGFFANTYVNLATGCCAGRNMTFARRAARVIAGKI